MRTQLDSKVNSMRSQAMTFSNNGVEFSLSIPDSSDVKSTFGTFISTIVQQQNKIEDLQDFIKNLKQEHSKAILELKDQTEKSVNDLTSRNTTLSLKLQKALQHIDNFSYNMQGYVTNEDETKHLPTIVESEVEEEEKNETNVAFFPTEDSSDDKKTPSSLYHKINNRVPPNPKARWHWAFNNVKKALRMKKQQIGLTRARVPKGQSLIDRLERLEQDLFSMTSNYENVKSRLHEVEEEQRLNELKRAEEKEKLRHQREEEERIRQQQREEELELIRLREAMRSEMQSDVDVQSTRPTSGIEESANLESTTENVSSSIINPTTENNLQRASESLSRGNNFKIRCLLNRVVLLEQNLEKRKNKIDKLSSDFKDYMNDAKELLKSGKVDLPDVNAIDSSARMGQIEMKGFETDVFFLNDSIDLIKNDAEYIRTITTAEDGSESNDATKQIKKDIITVIDRCDGMKLKLKGHDYALNRVRDALKKLNPVLLECWKSIDYNLKSTSILEHEIIQTTVVREDEKIKPITESVKGDDVNTVADDNSSDVSAINREHKESTSSVAEKGASKPPSRPASNSKSSRPISARPMSSRPTSALKKVSSSGDGNSSHLKAIPSQVELNDISEIDSTVMVDDINDNLSYSPNSGSNHNPNSISNDSHDKMNMLRYDLDMLKAQFHKLEDTFAKARLLSNGGMGSTFCRSASPSIGSRRKSDTEIIPLSDPSVNTVSISMNSSQNYNPNHNSDNDWEKKLTPLIQDLVDNYVKANWDLSAMLDGDYDMAESRKKSKSKTSSFESDDLKESENESDSDSEQDDDDKPKKIYEKELHPRKLSQKLGTAFPFAEFSPSSNANDVNDEDEDDDRIQPYKMIPGSENDIDKDDQDDDVYPSHLQHSSVSPEVLSVPGSRKISDPEVRRKSILKSPIESRKSSVAESERRKSSVSFLVSDAAPAGGKKKSLASPPPSASHTAKRELSTTFQEDILMSPKSMPAPLIKGPSTRKLPAKEPSVRMGFGQTTSSQLPVNSSYVNQPIDIKATFQHEMESLLSQMDAIYQNKLDARTGLQLLSTKANSTDLLGKVDLPAFEQVERTLRDVTDELGDIKTMQKKEISKLKKALQNALINEVSKIVASKEQARMNEDHGDDPFASITTKALCLNCGRPATVRTAPKYHPEAPSFRHSIVNSTPGEDIKHAGFKLPVFKDPELFYPLSPQKRIEVSAPFDHLHFNDEEDMQETTLRLQTAPTLGISQSLALMQPSRPLEPVKGKILKPVRHAQGREDGKRLRPIHRKGFPIRSTMRAMTTYAPERFDINARDMTPSSHVDLSNLSSIH